jgi:hypothetical protein
VVVQVDVERASHAGLRGNHRGWADCALPPRS